ncbi:UDP-N-acetylmuramoyl-tripeptide--D-alanyl-D-alanine ligase [Erythrobacteraceae bacterium CFH 75059]|uniref:UDP-N-acetylmuramoyl-tripeptide--D-alanyl-D- alanine ligase n=1 Tax=Qipengyuania thermophila TaxID=2509361 RepID=UPI001021ACC4|nr:UDP-N-acetylmuramoyl-tripeptide--D-alanyl-D-alanine ligase [Qipengyuania thermophila]TCD06182.1 UDP-N-acetylmuramoyl-tripeptide--D-alanyl-D-alanine ligase [Erythrobacteraceae bacterium CFH 75059]
MTSIPALSRWPSRPDGAAAAALWTAAELAAATGGTASEDFCVSGVEIDSRDVRDGDLFIALPGEQADGHAFVDAAMARGARAALVSRPVDHPHILVQDTRQALHDLAAHARRRSRATIVGVTGSVGKTGVKEALFVALERGSRGRAHRSVRSYNNHVGVPLSLARMSARTSFGVFEMGMNHAGEIDALTRQVRPHVAVITAIAPAHIENLGSMEAIAAAKAEIFNGVEPGGVAVIPADSPYFPQLAEAARAYGIRIVSFGASPGADMRLVDRIAAANGGSLVTVEHSGGRLVFSVAEPGEHWAMNALAVMAAVLAVGGDAGAAGLALAEMGGLKGRGARHRVPAAGGKALVIDESYNANPASMRATLAQLGQTPAGRRIAVLGSMKELGDFSERFHAGLAEAVKSAGLDHVVLVGDEMQALARELRSSGIQSAGGKPDCVHFATVADAIAHIGAYGLIGGDAVLVKGSNSMQLARLVDELLHRTG